jgi:ankyrin repeat protein
LELCVCARREQALSPELRGQERPRCCCSLLLEHRADVAAVDGLTAFHSVATGHTARLISNNVGTDYAPIVRLLVKHRADINASPDNLTALHLAAREGHAAAIDAFLEHGAELEAVSEGLTPLGLALDYEELGDY